MDSITDAFKNAFQKVGSAAFGILGSFFLPLMPIVGLILGALADPQGALNAIACRIIDLVAFPFPTTPPEMKLVAIISVLGNKIPLIGSAIIYDFVSTLGVCFLMVVGIKIYKMIPFKMS